MNDEQILMNINPLVAQLQKQPEDFTMDDIIRFISDNDVHLLNLMYPGGDGRLKTLSFVITSLAYLRSILTCGERVDGSSLFNYIEASNSDLYVLPRFSTAFLSPFAEHPTLCMLCSFFDKDGHPLESSPEWTLRKAVSTMKERTGLDFHAMGELEYYVIKPAETAYPAREQHGYHESGPYAKAGAFRTRCMEYIARAGGIIKYGHSEVGNFVRDGLMYEQNEIELLPVPAQKAADELLIAKWVIRNLGYREGYDVTFAPKITTGEAGSGLHFHIRLMKDGKSVMTEGGRLSDTARKAIAGLLDVAPALTAFGNRNPTSYFRLVPHQEAPTNVCWADRNRSALVRVPLGWSRGVDMCREANPGEPAHHFDTSDKQTFEIRSADGSAEPYEMLAGICTGCLHGLEMPNALKLADETYVDVNIHDDQYAEQRSRLKQLPDSCAASADCLEKQRKLFEQYGIFSPKLIDATLSELRAYNDRSLRTTVNQHPEDLPPLVEKFFHCG